MFALSLFWLLTAGYEPSAVWQPQIPRVDKELVRGFEDLLVAIEERDANEPVDRMFAEDMIREHTATIEKEMGRTELLSTLVQCLLFVERPEGISREVHILLSMSWRLLLAETEARPLVQTVAPFWPPANERISADSINLCLEAVSLSEDASQYFVDFTVFIELLHDEWAVGSSELDGLLDYMYEREAVMAWLAVLRLDGVSEEERDELYDRLSKVLHPYNDYYRTRPDRLPPGTREGLHELLVEYSQDDSLWARVFVAEILNKVPYMRKPAIEATLREDPHWLIQRRLAYLDEEGEDAAAGE